MPALETDRIDFTSERGRHEAFVGREDVLEALAAALTSSASRGYLLVCGGPGRGKSAMLARYLEHREAAGETIPHHFIRRGQQSWDQPDAVVRNLACRIEALFPAQTDAEARAEDRLPALLQRVSKEVLVPEARRLLLLIDGLDEIQERADTGRLENPLPRFLPHVLPPGVFVLVSSRPTDPHLSWLRDERLLLEIDLDATHWQSSNTRACRLFWERAARGMKPPLGPGELEKILEAVDGNLLYAVQLERWLEQPGTERRIAALPRTFEAFLQKQWDGLLELPHARAEQAVRGLGLLCAAREALPLSHLRVLAGWSGVRADRDFVQAVRPLLLEEGIGEALAGKGSTGTTTAGSGVRDGSLERTYRPFHESFRNFVARQLGGLEMRDLHRTLAEKLAAWPAPGGESVTLRGPFQRRYALRHGIRHRLEAQDWLGVRTLATDIAYLEEKCREAGATELEADLRDAARQLPERKAKEELAALERAVRQESHWLRTHPESIDSLVYNRLRCSGWDEARIRKTLRFPPGRPIIRLRHPVRLGGQEIRTLVGHTSGVTTCAWSPDGRWVVSGSWDNTLNVWDPETGGVITTLEGHTDGVTACAWSPDGRRVVSGSQDNTLKIWDPLTGAVVSTLEGHTGPVDACAWSPDGRRVVSGSEDSTLKVWDPLTGAVVATLEGHTNAVNACAWSPDGRRVVSGSRDSSLKVWDPGTGAVITTLQGHRSAVYACAWSPDGRRVVSGSRDGSLKVWDLQAGAVMATLMGHKRDVSGCAWSPDGRRVISGSWDRTLTVWDPQTGTEIATLVGHTDWVTGCAWSPDSRRVVSGSGDGSLKVWASETGAAASTLKGHSNWVQACAWSPVGQRVVSGSGDRTLKVWDPETGAVITTLEGHAAWVYACAWRPDGGRVISASGDRTLKVWDPLTGAVVATLEGHARDVSACAWNPDGRRVVSASGDRTLKVWDLETRAVMATLKGHTGWVYACAWCPNGRQVVSGSRDRTLKVWDPETRAVIATLVGHAGEVSVCAWSPDGRRVMSGSLDRTLKVWDPETEAVIATLEGHADWVTACAWSPDGRQVISGSRDRTIKVWDLETSRCITTVHGLASFTSVSISRGALCAGDGYHNLWFLDLAPNFDAPDAITDPEPAPSAPRPIRLFYVSSPADESLRQELATHLAPLRRQGLLEDWHEGMIPPGVTRKLELDAALERADIVLLLVSAEFMASDECHEVALKRALERHARGVTRVIPVLLGPCDWQTSPFAGLQCVPRDLAPLASLRSRDEGWTRVVGELRAVVESLHKRTAKG